MGGIFFAGGAQQSQSQPAPPAQQKTEEEVYTADPQQRLRDQRPQQHQQMDVQEDVYINYQGMHSMGCGGGGSDTSIRTQPRLNNRPTIVLVG